MPGENGLPILDITPETMTGFGAMSPQSAFLALGTALGLGLLVGLQRERGSRRVAGIRTFPLITILGAVGALLANDYAGWPLAIAGLGLVASMIVSAFHRGANESREPGITTEMAILVMFLVGILTGAGYTVVAVVCTGIVALLLHLKEALHNFAQRLGEHDVRAVMQFTLITLVILPILPNRTFGPFDVLNPREVWLFVVLVVTMSLAAYIASRLVGERAGTILNGLLGGAISSTATTVSNAQRLRSGNAYVTGAALAIMLASSVSFVRVLIEIGVVADQHFLQLAPPIIIMLGTMALLSCLLLFAPRKTSGVPTTQQNPSELKGALVFGVIFATVILSVAAARRYFGESGAYAVAVISGLIDMDAITLSTARLVRAGELPTETGWRTIVIASMSNLIFKGTIAMVIGGRKLAMIIAPLFGIVFLVGAGLLIFWG